VGTSEMTASCLCNLTGWLNKTSSTI